MTTTYLQTPGSVSYEMLMAKNCSLSSSQYKNIQIPNKNVVEVRKFLDRELKRKDLGTEVGSLNYIGKSTHYFIRTKALKRYSFIPDITSESTLPIMPSSYVEMDLKKGDIIISKDSNIGEVIVLEKDYPKHMLSGALYKLPVTNNKYYLLAMIKHPVFREQLDFLVPKGSTIRHAKTLFLDCKIPMPKKNTDNTIKYIEILTKAVIKKEALIKKRHKEILNVIEEELLSHQSDNKFEYALPSYSEINKKSRLDSNLYSEIFKKEVFILENYNKGFSSIKNLGFTLSRGQNLQVSSIGKSVYSSEAHTGFYTLMLPKYLSKYGTVEQVSYLGNPRKLKTLNKGDLIFGAEGFEKGRSIVIIEGKEKVITNIHGITITQEEHDIEKAIYVKCILDYLRSKGLIDLYAVGGNGGSLAQKYWDIIPFPNLRHEIKSEISKLYHNPKARYSSEKLTLENFEKFDAKFNDSAGINELDLSAKKLKDILNNSIDNIVNDVEVIFDFSNLNKTA